MTDPREIRPEDAMAEAERCHRAANDLRAQSRAMYERRNMAIRVAYALAGKKPGEVAKRLGVSRQMVQYVVQGHTGGSHLILRVRDAFPVPEEPIDLDKWLRS